jgi:DNA-binding CsgD family transcriptional regulator
MPTGDDDNEVRAARLKSQAARYGELYPDLHRRLREISESRDPGLQRRAAALNAGYRQRATDRSGVLIAKYRLTPAEVRVALHLIDGGDLGSCAETAGVGLGTVRAQLKSIFAKTGVNRQAALVRLGQMIL